MRAFAFLCFQFALMGPALAWGAVGHRTVAVIAEHYMDPAAAASVRELLSLEGSTSIVEVAKWADTIRPEARPDAPHHSVRLPLDSSSYDAGRDCPGGRCIVEALKTDIQTLNDPSRSSQDRLTALKYIVHFLGDIHSPLQVTKRKAGKLIVSAGGVTMPVAKFWDNQGPGRTGLKERALADRIIQNHSGRAVAQGAPEQWATESRDVAVQAVLKGLPRKNDKGAPYELPAEYLEGMTPIVEDQLFKAGVRLAGVLNAAFD